MNWHPPAKRDVITAGCLYALNLFDMAATAYAVTKGYAMELNPLMRALMGRGMTYFVLFKIVIIFFLAWALLFIPVSKHINTVLVFVTGMYAMVGLMHILIFLSQHGR